MSTTPNTLPHLEVIAGTMFSGKSTELIRRCNSYEVLGFKVQLFKPSIDDRYSQDHVQSHDGLKKSVNYVTNLNDLKEKYDNSVDVVGIEEVQFLESGIVDFAEYLVDEGKKIVAMAGLLKNFKDEYFSFSDGKLNMADLVRRADFPTLLTAYCTFRNGDLKARPCGNHATRVQRFVSGDVAPFDADEVLVGGQEAYEPRCREHFNFYK
jgi:thymidine kinase